MTRTLPWSRYHWGDLAVVEPAMVKCFDIIQRMVDEPEHSNPGNKWFAVVLVAFQWGHFARLTGDDSN